MKKALLGTFVTLFIMLALISCDSIIGDLGPAKPVEYTPDGQKLVEVSIVCDIDRSITNAIAKNAANYMEVIFKKGGQFYRAEGLRFLPLKVKIPAGSYVIGDAILLLGRNSDKTLLATGILTSNFTASSSSSISFTVTSLGVDLSNVGNSFSIDETTGSVTISGSGSGFDGETSNGNYQGTGCFQVPSGSNGIKASLTFSGFNSTGADIEMDSTSSIVSIIRNSTPSAVTVPITLPASVTTGIGTGIFEFTFDTLTTTGDDVDIYLLYFDIKVVGFQAGITSAILWSIRGGTSDGADIGDTETKEAEGVLLIASNTPPGSSSEVIGTVTPPTF
jgi:hypothetical protein